MTVGNCIFGRSRHLIENSPTTLNALPTGVDSTEKCRQNTQAEKCCFFAETIDYLCPVVHSERVEIAETTPKRIQELQKLTTQIEARSFLGFCGDLQQIVLKFLTTDVSLNRTLRKDQSEAFF